jgi:hypothetical protein
VDEVAGVAAVVERAFGVGLVGHFVSGFSGVCFGEIWRQGAQMVGRSVGYDIMGESLLTWSGDVRNCSLPCTSSNLDCSFARFRNSFEKA